MSDPTDEPTPKPYRAGITFVADRRWKLWAQVVLFCLIVGGAIRLGDWLFS